jgi:hypothetical protein
MEIEQIAALLAEATPEAAAKLQEIAETTREKESRKAARRALHRLSLAGIVPPEHAPRSGSGEANTPDTLRAFASAFDGAGNRLMMFLQPDPDGGSPTLGQVFFDDESGVRSFEAVRQPRREVMQRIEQYEQRLEEGIALAEIEGDYGRWLLRDARDLNRQHGRATPQGFLDWVYSIGEPRGDYSTPPVFAAINPEGIRGDQSFSHDPSTFFALPWFDPWFFDIKDVARWLEAWEQVETGVVAQSESVQEERRERIVTEAVTALLTSEMRTRYIRRLEESADVLRRRGKEEATRMALYHALMLTDNMPAADVPFARVLVRRTIEAALEAIQAYKQQQAETAGEPSAR